MRRGQMNAAVLCACRRPLGGAFIAVSLAVALSACGSSGGGGSTGSGGAIAGSLTQPGLYGKLPSAGTPTSGGTITFGQLSGSTPDFIVPIVPSAASSTTTFQ